MSGCVRKHLCYCTDCGRELARRLKGKVVQDCIVSKTCPKKISPVEKTTSKCYVCGADDPTCSVLHGSTYNHRNAYSLLLKLVSRKCTCYCQVCACKEFAVLGKKCKHKCPVCRREVDRIVVKDAVDDERIPALRRCKSAVIVREKLEAKISGIHTSVVPVQREPPNQTGDEGGLNTKRELAIRRYNETMSAIGKLLEKAPAVHGAKVPPGQRESSSQTVVKTKQNTQRSLTLRRYMKALSAFKKLVYVISDYSGAEVQLQQESSSQKIEEGGQNVKTCSVVELCEEAMSALEEMVKELLGNCDAETPDQQESTTLTVVKVKQITWWGDVMIGMHEKAKTVYNKLSEAVQAYSTVKTPTQQASSDQTVVEDTWTLRQVPLLYRCESATFSWDKQCPICQMPPDIDHESRCVSSRLTNCVVLQHLLQEAPLLLH